MSNTHLDIALIGTGLAGCTLAWQLHFAGKKVLLIGDNKAGSSHVAAGVYNPTILKRFTAVWKAQDMMVSMSAFYDQVEACLNLTVRNPLPIYRRFHKDQEITTWHKKRLKPELNTYLEETIYTDKIKGIDAPYGYGIVRNVGWVDTQLFISSTIKYFTQLNQCLNTHIDMNTIDNSASSFWLAGFNVDKIVFAQGFDLKTTSLFSHIPIQGNKGELLIIKVPNLKLECTIKSSVFLMPFKEDLFWVGATYNREYDDALPSESGKQFLMERLERFLKLPYKIIEHKSGIRPTVIDRRPVIGSLNNLAINIFNGMGSRAVLIAPWVATQLINNLYFNKPLDKEIDVKRFD